MSSYSSDNTDSDTSDTDSIFLSREEAINITNHYVQHVQDESKQPKFVNTLSYLLREATKRQKYLITVQIGGMDGKTGDPMFTMVKKYLRKYSSTGVAKTTSTTVAGDGAGNDDDSSSDDDDDGNLLKHCIPIVVEPVPTNVRKLVQIYQKYQTHYGLQCGHVLNQLISYNTNHDNNSNNNNDNYSEEPKCTFCHFDPTKIPHEETNEDEDEQQANNNNNNNICLNIEKTLPTYQIGSIGTCNDTYTLKRKCFTESLFACGSIQSALERLHITNPNKYMSVLQMDVEGYEKELLSGYFSYYGGRSSSTSSTTTTSVLYSSSSSSSSTTLTSLPPPVINFESKVLLRRKQLQYVSNLLQSSYGYTLYTAKGGIDTLAILQQQQQ